MRITTCENKLRATLESPFRKATIDGSETSSVSWVECLELNLKIIVIEVILIDGLD